MESKHTTVEWLVDNLHYLHSTKWNDIVEQAKEMHKKEIIDCGNSCAIKQHIHIERVNKMSMDEMLKFAEEETLTFGEQYYNETYNK